MKRFLTVIALLAPLSIAACGDDDDKTTIIQPTQPSGTVVVPQSNEPGTVVVPR